MCITNLQLHNEVSLNVSSDNALDTTYYFHKVQSYHTCLPAISQPCQHLDTGLHSGVLQIHLCQERAFGAFAIPKWVNLPTPPDHNDQSAMDIKVYSNIICIQSYHNAHNSLFDHYSYSFISQQMLTKPGRNVSHQWE